MPFSLLPEAVAAYCLSFLSSLDHSRCACACARFRVLGLAPGGFPDEVRVDSRHLAGASPALARMRPRRLLEIRVLAASPSPGCVSRLLAQQTRVERIRLTLAGATSPSSPSSRTAFGRCDLRGALAASAKTSDDGDRARDEKKSDDGDGDETLLEACRQLQVGVRAESWSDWLPALLRRMPNLARLELHRFPERLLSLLCEGAPRLVELRIDGHDQTAVDGVVPANDLGFARRVLAGLPALRSLALPYATVMWRDLLVAADRLESLRVRLLSDMLSLVRHTPEHARRTATVRMTRLTHLVAEFHGDEADAIFERLPALCAGVLGFRAREYVMSQPAVRLVAEISETIVADDERGVHVHWSSERNAPDTYELAAGAGVRMAKLDRPWRSQTHAASLSAATCRLLRAELVHSRSIRTHALEPAAAVSSSTEC